MPRRPVVAPDYQSLFEGAPDLYLVLAPDLTIVGVSEAYRRATMTVRDEIIGRGLFEVFPDNPDDIGATGASNLRASLNRALELKLPDLMALQKYDIPRPAAEGGGFEERYWSPLNVPVIGPEGDVAWIIHRVEDVTESVRQKEHDAQQMEQLIERNAAIDRLREVNRTLAREIVEKRRIESNLAEAQSFHDAIVENIPATIFAKDAENLRFVLVNRAGEKLLGVGREELIGKSDYDFFPKEQADFFVARDRETLRAGKLQITEEEPITTRDRGVRMLRTAKIPVLDRDGRPKYLLAMSEDITDRKAAESQLRQAQKMEAIGNLTGGIAHDFNNLLGVIIGNLDLLATRLETDTEATELSREALEAALRGAELTQRLLTFARRQPLEPRRVDVNEIVTRVNKLISRALGENIEMSIELSGQVWPVHVDPAQFEAAVLNIINNAADAMPRGGMLMIGTSNRFLDEDYVASHPGLAAGEYAMVEISDTGTGMPPEVVSQIFEPFFTTKEQGKGTGLGLSMVFGFIRQSEGHVHVYSEVGVGTTFRLYLPRNIAAGEVVAIDRPVAPDRGGHETVLAVEDNVGLRRIVARQLRELGYRLLEAPDGPAALKVLEDEPVDLLFTDIIMPGGMSGYDLAQAAKSRWPEIKVVLTSGFPETKLNGNGNGHGAAGMRLLTKPYRKADLARTLREVLDA